MSRLKNLSVFRFCAIPQVMAIATLAKLYGNPKVFHGVVKIRKGLAAKMILNTKSYSDVCEIFEEFANDIKSGVRDDDPSAESTLGIVNEIIRVAKISSKKEVGRSEILPYAIAGIPFAVVIAYGFLSRNRS